MSGVYTTVDGVRQTLYAPLDRSYREVQIHDLIIKNNGTDPAPAETEFRLYFSRIGGVGEKFYTGTAGKVIPGKSFLTLPVVTLTADKIRELDQKDFFVENNSEKHYRRTVQFFVDSNDKITETDEHNNYSYKLLFESSVIKVYIRQTGSNGAYIKDLTHLTIRIKSDGHNQARSGPEDHYIPTIFSLLRKPGTDVEYTIEITDEDQKIVATKKVTIDAYEVYAVNVDIEQGGTIFIPVLMYPVAFDPTSFRAIPLVRIGSDGFAVIETDQGLLYRQKIFRGRARFSDIPIEVKKIQLVEIEATVKFAVGPVKDTIRYHWLSDQNEPLEVDPESTTKVEIKLKTECFPGTPTIEFCIYDEPERIAAAKISYLPIFSRALTKLGNFDPSVSLKVTKTVWVVPYFLSVGEFDEYYPDLLWIMGRYAAADPTFAEDVITHEAIHAIDYQLGWYSIDFPYSDSAARTAEGNSTGELTEATGLWSWANIGHTCALASGNFKNFCLGHANAGDGPREILAEQVTNVCLRLPVQPALDNVEGIWIQTHPKGEPIPPDLLLHRDIIASRSLGANGLQRGRIIYNYSGGVAENFYSYILQTLVSNCEAR